MHIQSGEIRIARYLYIYIIYIYTCTLPRFAGFLVHQHDGKEIDDIH